MVQADGADMQGSQSHFIKLQQNMLIKTVSEVGAEGADMHQHMLNKVARWCIKLRNMVFRLNYTLTPAAADRGKGLI